MIHPDTDSQSTAGTHIGHEQPKIYALIVPRDEADAHIEAGEGLDYIERFDTRDDTQVKRGQSQVCRANKDTARHFSPRDFRLLHKDADIVALSATPTQYDAYNLRVKPLLEVVRKKRAERQAEVAQRLEVARAAMVTTGKRPRP